MGPLIAECVGRGFLFRVQIFSQKARDAADDGEPGSAALADQAALDHLGDFHFLGNDVEALTARWACQERCDGWFQRRVEEDLTGNDMPNLQHPQYQIAGDTCRDMLQRVPANDFT